jgi:hypothetical protein
MAIAQDELVIFMLIHTNIKASCKYTDKVLTSRFRDLKLMLLYLQEYVEPITMIRENGSYGNRAKRENTGSKNNGD